MTYQEYVSCGDQCRSSAKKYNLPRRNKTLSNRELLAVYLTRVGFNSLTLLTPLDASKHHFPSFKITLKNNVLPILYCNVNEKRCHNVILKRYITTSDVVTSFRKPKILLHYFMQQIIFLTTNLYTIIIVSMI